MAELEVIQIWNPKTGITKPTDVEMEFSSPLAREIQADWVAIQSDFSSSEQLQKFNSELKREWSIETGIIENLYSLDRGVTLTLIEQGFDASLIPHGSANKPPEEVTSMLNDHQNALDWLFDFVAKSRPFGTSFIRELHALMTASQTSYMATQPNGERIELPMVQGDYKVQPNFPSRDGKLFTYCPPGDQTASEMERLVGMSEELRASGVQPEIHAAWLHHRFTQIHPFADGNGRVARALATLVLIQGRMFPLMVDRDEKAIYIECLEKADEGDLNSLVRMMVRLQENQIRKARQLVAKIQMKSDSVEESIAKYIAIASESNEAVGKRASARSEKYLNRARGIVNEFERQNSAAFTNAGIIYPLSTQGLNQIQTTGALSEFALTKTGIRMDFKFHFFAVEDKHQHYWIVCTQDQMDAHGTLVAFAFLGKPDDPKPIFSEVFRESHPATDKENLDRFLIWFERCFAAIMQHVAETAK